MPSNCGIEIFMKQLVNSSEIEICKIHLGFDDANLSQFLIGLAAYMDHSVLMSTVLPLFLRLASDPSFHVRRVGRFLTS